jgi:hypothetical protein
LSLKSRKEVHPAAAIQITISIVTPPVAVVACCW